MPGEADESALRRRAQFDRSGSIERMAFGNGQAERIGQPDRLQAADRSEPIAHDPGIDFHALQGLQLRIGNHLDDLDVALRPPLAQFAQQPRQHHVARRGNEADAQLPALGVADAVGQAFGAVRPGQQVLGFTQEMLARQGEPHPARITDQQPCAEFVLQLPDLHRQGRLRDEQLFRRARDAAAFGDADEVAQMTEFHTPSIRK